MGMGVVISEGNEPPRLDRQTGRVSSIKPKNMKESYMPMADITNSMSSIMKASFAFFDKVTDDPIFLEFSKQCCIFMVEARSGNNIWEKEALPALNKICKDFSKSPNFAPFLVKFFMCVMDFYWHNTRLSSGDKEATDRNLFEKALNLSSIIRSMPENIRESYLDHLGVFGMFPDMMDNESKGETCS